MNTNEGTPDWLVNSEEVCGSVVVGGRQTWLQQGEPKAGMRSRVFTTWKFAQGLHKIKKKTIKMSP